MSSLTVVSTNIFLVLDLNLNADVEVLIGIALASKSEDLCGDSQVLSTLSFCFAEIGFAGVLVLFSAAFTATVKCVNSSLSSPC